MGRRLEMVGPNGLEPSTSSVSGKRSNQLSYGPIPIGVTLPTQAIDASTLEAQKDMALAITGGQAQAN